MALSKVVSPFGLHEIVLYNPNDWSDVYFTGRVLASFALNFEREIVPLNGGSSPDAYCLGSGLRTVEGEIVISEIPDKMIDVFTGATSTINSAEASGNVGSLTNQNGTSVQNATTGIASATALSGSEANLKTGVYAVKAVSSTTVDIYALASFDFNTGTDGTLIDDSRKITSSPLTITASTDTDVTNYGFKLTGGSGTIGMTTDDVAYFEVRSVNNGSAVTTVGSINDQLTEFGLIMESAKSGCSNFYVQVYKCLGGGFPVSATANQFNERTLTFQARYDENEDAIYKHIVEK